MGWGGHEVRYRARGSARAAPIEWRRHRENGPVPTAHFKALLRSATTPFLHIPPLNLAGPPETAKSYLPWTLLLRSAWCQGNPRQGRLPPQLRSHQPQVHSAAPTPTRQKRKGRKATKIKTSPGREGWFWCRDFQGESSARVTNRVSAGRLESAPRSERRSRPQGGGNLAGRRAWRPGRAQVRRAGLQLGSPRGRAEGRCRQA